MTLPLVLLNRRRIGGFSPRAIIAGSTALLWLDPSDLITLFQDAAGTTPVTAPGQPVGLALDKSKGLVLGPELATVSSVTGVAIGGPTFTNYQISSALVVDRAYRITFTVSGYSGTGSVNIQDVAGRFEPDLPTAGLSGNGTYSVIGIAQTTDPVGVFTRSTNTANFSNISVRELPGFHATQSTAANRPTYGVVPSRGRVNILNATATLATQTRPVTAAQHTLSFRGTGTITLSGASTAGPLVGTGANDIVSLTFTPTAGNLTLTVSGTVNDAQLELGAARGTYQLVSDAAGFNITDPVGFPSYPLHYLFFGGDLDPRWLQTSTITPNADKVQVFAGVRKLSDAARGVVVELSASLATNQGTFNLNAPFDANPNFGFASRGSAVVSSPNLATPFASPITRVLSGIGDIANDVSTLRVNGAVAAQTTDDQGTGNYLAYPIFIGRRGGTSLAFNGQLYGLIVRFSTANLDASVISQTERWMAQKTGVTI